MPPTTALDWEADALVDLDNDEDEEDDPDWDDVAILIGSQIVRKVRVAIREQLKYTCSAGVAQNKMVAKLGSAYKKPNQQTVVRNRAILQFLSEFKFTKIRSFGGKFGDQIVAAFGTDTVKELRGRPLGQLRQKLGDETGTRVYQLIRGIDHSEVNPRTQIKSMLSAKSFRPTVNTGEQATRWLKIFVADIHSRLEEAYSETKRKAKNMQLHYRSSRQDRSKSSPIPLGKELDQQTLLDLAKKLLASAILDGNLWPCANLSLSVSGFEDSLAGNMGIGGFLVKGKPEPKIKDREHNRTDSARQLPSEKRRKVEAGGSSIQRFFNGRHESTADREKSENKSPQSETAQQPNDDASSPAAKQEASEFIVLPASIPAPKSSAHAFMCEQCDERFYSENLLLSHNDWHFAKSLLAEDARANAHRRPVPAARSNSGGKGRKVSKGGPDKSGKTQTKLTFG